jgi:transcriptional regulator with XRE-family HTH domain
VKITGRELARRTGINASHIARVLRGERGMSLRTANRIADALGLSIGQFNVRYQAAVAVA